MFTPVETRLGVQPIAFTNAANTALQSGQSPFANQEHPLGTIIRGYDPTFGEGEFIYLLGVTSTRAGSLVSWDAVTFQTTLVLTTARLSAPVAIAMSANVGGQWGWYQISGMATALKAADQITAITNCYLGTTGIITKVSAAGKQILGARIIFTATVTTTTSFCTVHLSRPVVQGFDS